MSKNAIINIKFASNIEEFSRELDKGYGSVRRMSDGLMRIGKQLTVAVTLPIALIGKEAIQAYAKIEMLQLGLENIMGSAKAATSEYQKLLETAKKPGIGLEEALEGSIRLQSIGVSADKSRRVLEGLANALASVGKGKEEMSRLVYGFEQLANTPFPLMEDLRIIRNSLPQTTTILAREFKGLGAISAESLRQAGITSQEVIAALLRGLEKLPKFEGGIRNAIDNLGDSYTKFMAAIGKSIDKNVGLTNFLNSIGNTLTKLAEWFDKLNPKLQTFIIVLTGLLAILGPLAVAIAAVGYSIQFLGLTIGTIMPIIGLLVITTALIAKNIGGVKKLTTATEMMDNAMANAAGTIERQSNELETLYNKIINAAKGTRERNELIAEWDSKYGTHISQIKGESDKIIELGNSYKELTRQIRVKAEMEALSGESGKIAADIERQKARIKSLAKERVDMIAPNVTGIGAFGAAIFEQLSVEALRKKIKEEEKQLNEYYEYQKQIKIKLDDLGQQLKPTGGEIITPTLTAEQLSAIKKRNEDLKKIDEQAAKNNYENYIKYSLKKWEDSFDNLTKADRQTQTYIEARRKEENKLRMTWFENQIKEEKEHCDLINQTKKEGEDEKLRLIEEKYLQTKALAQINRNADILSEYDYNQKLNKAEEDRITAQRNIYDVGSKGYLEKNIELNDLIISNKIATTNDLERINREYNSIIKQNNELAQQEQTDIVKKQIDDNKALILQYQKWATEHGIVFTIKTETDTTDLEKSWANTANAIKRDFAAFITDTITTLADALGSSMAGAKDAFDNMGNKILQSLGRFMIKMGSAMLAWGIWAKFFKESIKTMNPEMAIIAGTGMIIAGAAISTLSKRGIEQGSNSDISTNNYSTRSGGGYNPNAEMELHSVLDGRDLVLSSERTTYLRRR